MKLTLNLTCIFVSLSLVAGCNSNSNVPLKPTTEITFSEVGHDIIPFENRNRRKWDNPVISDLDQDGLVDILTSDHGSAINIHWNLGGRFSKPQTILKKDIHGVTAADFDNDGKVELIVAQGGGNGKKPKYPILFEVAKNRKVTRSDPYTYFEFTRGRAAKFIDANNDGVLEFIQTGFPLKAQTEGANFLYELDNNNLYQYVTNLPQAKWLGYRLSLTDVNNDGIQDLMFYGGADTILLQGQKGLEYLDITQTALAEHKNTDHISSVSPIDFDNDGDLDLLITRSKPQFHRQSFYDVENKRFAFFTFKETYQFPDLKIKGDLVVNNLQQAHPDFDVFVGADKTELTFDVDKHGHKDFTLTQKEAKGWPNNVEQKGVYLGYLGDDTWRLLVNTRSRTAGVLNNVISTPDTAPLEELPVKLLENKNGRFVDVAVPLGLDIKEQTTSAVTADFNNDGWQDVFIVKYGNMSTSNKQYLYLNIQGEKFELVKNHGITSYDIGATGSGAEAVDYDADGDVDIVFANERGKWHMFENNLTADNANRSITINVGLSPLANATFLGAKVSVEACGLQQSKYLGHSSAPYSQNSNQLLHFGLASCTADKKVTVTWSNGESKEVTVVGTENGVSVGDFLD